MENIKISGIKKNHRKLKEEEVIELNINIDNNVFKIYTKTQLSCFYRCVYCRNCNYRNILINNSFYLIKPHTMNCKFRRNKIKNIDNIEINSEINSEIQYNHWKSVVDERINNLPNEISGQSKKYDIPLNFEKDSNKSLSKNINNEKNSRNNIYVLKLAKIDQEDIEKFKISFDYAMKIKKMKFYDDLHFPNGKINIPDKYLNEIQLLSLENEETFKKFKDRSRNKIYAPIFVENHPLQGFIVKACKHIPIHTIICEYSGSVVLLDDDLKNEDSLMEYASFENEEFVINPNKLCNIARFISGINNFEKSAKKNLESMKFRINRDIFIILYTKRAIEKNETLYYNYNGIYFNYDTSQFI